MGGWLVFPFLAKLEPAKVQALKQRVADELKTTFASRYERTISLAEVLQPDVIAGYDAARDRREIPDRSVEGNGLRSRRR